MPSRKRKIDEDLVIGTQYKKQTKEPLPEPWALPTFEPLHGLKLEEQGKPVLAAEIDPTSAAALFDLLWDSECVDLILQATNANARANPPQKGPRWRDLTASELYGWLGIHIYASRYHVRQLRDLWATDSTKGPVHGPVLRCMARDRFMQIDRFIHVSSEPPEVLRTQSPFQKIAILSARLQANFAAVWIAGSHLAVDECIQRFTGRSNATVTIPCKPTPTGYKVWVLAERGYVLNWLWHRKGETHGPIDLDTKWLAEGFTKTESVPLTLLSRLPDVGKGSIVYLDNLFTSSRLCRAFREQGIGVCGTVRMSTTQREDFEASQALKRLKISQESTSQPLLAPAGLSILQTDPLSQPAQPALLLLTPLASQLTLISPEQHYSSAISPEQRCSSETSLVSAPTSQSASQNSNIIAVLPAPTTSQPQGLRARKKGQNEEEDLLNYPGAKGLHPKLVELKIKHNSDVPWGQLFACTSKCGQVLQFAWKDAQLAMMMSTVHRGLETIERLRRKPAKGSAGYAVAHKVFGDEHRKRLHIPGFIDDYNHHMHAVDLADQLRAGFTTTRRCRRTWKPLLYLLIDLTAINAFRLSSYCDPTYTRDFKRSSKHARFHAELALALMSRCEKKCDIRPPVAQKTVLIATVSSRAIGYHRHENGFKNNRCKACMAAGRRREASRRKRKPLGELSNINWRRSPTTGLEQKQYETDAPRTTYGCSICKINLCNHPRCWNEHLDAVKQKGWQELQSRRVAFQPSPEAINLKQDSFEYSSTIDEGEWPENLMEEEQWSDEGYMEQEDEAPSLAGFASEAARTPYFNLNFSTTTY